MQRPFAIFYREKGVRRINELLAPRLDVFKEFPRGAVFHHLTDDEELHLDSSKSFLQDFQKKIPIDFVFRSEAMVGKPRELPVQQQSIAMGFIRGHRNFRYLKDAPIVSQDERVPVVVNYNTLKMAYRFMPTPLSEMQKWESFHSALWAEIDLLADKTNKQHFVLVNTIVNIPSLSLLNNIGTKEGLTLARVFNTPDRLFVLHFFNFIRKDARSLSALRSIKEKNLPRVNLVFQTLDGRSSVLNLGYLFSWIKGNADLTGAKLQHDESVVARSFLKYLLVLSSSVPEEAAEEIPEDKKNDSEDLEETGDEEFPESSLQSKVLPPSPTNTPSPLPSVEPDSGDESSGLMARVDEDLEILEQKNRKTLHQRGVEIKDGKVQEISVPAVRLSYDEVRTRLYTKVTPNESLKQKMKQALDEGDLTAPTYKKALQESEKYSQMKDPYGSNTLVKDRVVVDPNALVIPEEKAQLKDSVVVFDKSMTHSSLQAYTSEYVSKHLRNDVLKMVGGLQAGGVIVQNHEVEIEHTITGSVELHRLELKPINGTASSVWFRLPVVEDDGTYVAGGNRYALKRQRVDLPIRKISPTEVSLSSYYGKTFVSTESKMANSGSDWIIRQINKASFEGSDWITEVAPGDFFDSYRNTPYIYGMLSTQFRSLKAGDVRLVFDNSVPEGKFPPTVQAKLDAGAVWCGVKGAKGKEQHVFLDQDDRFYALAGSALVDLGDVFTVLKLDPHKAPIRYSELALFKKNIPVGLVLGYRIGWTALLALMKAPYRTMETGKRLNLLPHEYPVVFQDLVYIFSRNDKMASMVLSGFMDFAKSTRRYTVKDFDHPDVYLNLMTAKGLGAIYIREIDMLFDYFVDPITQEILQDMKEPTTFEGLLLRATELLTQYKHPKNNDGAFTRIRGYERMAGQVYREMTASIRQFRSKNIAGRSKIDISPWKVWQALQEDPTKFLVPEINPIQDLKNDEGVTYVGEGGRSKDAINKASRSYHPNDVGTVSEATVDNSDVGVNVFMPADPTFKNLRGLKADSDIDNANRYSSACLNAPAVMHDDQNRIGFVSVQNSHGIQALGYHPAQYRTGFESLISQRTTPMFSYCAKADGKVVGLTESGVIIEYKDGKRVGLKIGREFGKAEGSTFPYDIESAVKMGQSFKKGDPIVYNTQFFEFDHWSPGQLVLKNSLVAKIGIWETKQTHEDACSISKKLSDRLATRVTYVRSFTVTFLQNIHNVVKVGQTLKPTDILMSIEDEITSTLGSFGQDALETLKGLSKQSPRVNYHGVVDRIEVFYHGEKEEMSPTLKKLADQSDSFIREKAASTNKPKFTGQVTNDYRVEGTPLGYHKAEIRFYVTVGQGMGVADKVVFANQMKSVNSEVMDYQLLTESGDEIEAVFGYRSIAARNVMSPTIIGTTITLLNLFAKEIVELHRGT